MTTPKQQWQQLTHAEKRAIAQAQWAGELETSKRIAVQQARQQTQDEAYAAHKRRAEEPQREAYEAYMAHKRRLMRG